MKSRILVTCLLWVWVFAVSAPSVLYITTDDIALINPLNAGEEEPGEGEKKGSAEEILILEESMRIFIGHAFRNPNPPLTRTAKTQDFFEEIILPPPEHRDAC